MTLSDWIPVVLFVMGFVQCVVCGLFTWVLVRVVRHGEDIRALKVELAGIQREVNSHRDDAEKKFDELKEYIGKLFEKIDNMNAQIGQVLLHRRAADKTE